MAIPNIQLDFQVLKTYDPKALLIADTSEWSQIKDEPSIIEITLPGGITPRVNYYQKHEINVFTSSILGINCGAECGEENLELPDGIYHIVIKGSPDKHRKERYYLKSDRLQLQFDKMYTKEVGLDLRNVDMDMVENLQNIELLIKGADASTRIGELAEASDYYKQAKKMLDAINCEK